MHVDNVAVASERFAPSPKHRHAIVYSELDGAAQMVLEASSISGWTHVGFRVEAIATLLDLGLGEMVTCAPPEWIVCSNQASAGFGACVLGRRLRYRCVFAARRFQCDSLLLLRVS